MFSPTATTNNRSDTTTGEPQLEEPQDLIIGLSVPQQKRKRSSRCPMDGRVDGMEGQPLKIYYLFLMIFLLESSSSRPL